MGLSASQARFLNLTARMHDIEYKAQNLEAQKLQMANESTQVYQEYENALNKQKVQFKQIGTDGAANYVDANLSTLIAAGYQIQIFNGSSWESFNRVNGKQLANTVSTEPVPAPAAMASAKLIENDLATFATDTFKDKTPGSVVKNGSDYYYVTGVDAEGHPITGYQITTTANNPTSGYNTNATVGEIVTHNSKKYQVVAINANSKPITWVELTTTAELITAAGGDLANIDVTDKDTLRNLVEAGFIIFEKPDTTSETGFTEVNIATDTSLQEVSDEVELKKAEAKYEADMRKINQKDKKFDTDLAAMDAERNAIKTEMDTLKTVAKENVDRTFKLFS